MRVGQHSPQFCPHPVAPTLLHPPCPQRFLSLVSLPWVWCTIARPGPSLPGPSCHWGTQTEAPQSGCRRVSLRALPAPCPSCRLPLPGPKQRRQLAAGGAAGGRLAHSQVGLRPGCTVGCWASRPASAMPHVCAWGGRGQGSPPCPAGGSRWDRHMEGIGGPTRVLGCLCVSCLLPEMISKSTHGASRSHSCNVWPQGPIACPIPVLGS